MQHKGWVAAGLALACLAGALFAGKPDTPSKPSVCTAKPQMKPGKIKVSEGKISVELKLTGAVTSAPKSDETLSPVINIKSFLMWKKAGGKWEHVDLANQEVSLGQLKGGSGAKIDKTVDSPAAAAVADTGAVDYELHLFIVGEACKMTPISHYLTFQVTYGKDPAPGTIKVASYSKKKTADKKAVLVSDATGVGWIDSAEGTPYAPAGPS